MASNVIVVAGSEDRESVLAAIRAGASGCLLKKMPPKELFSSPQTLTDGGSPVSPRIARALIDEIHGSYKIVEPILSRREREVIALMGKDLSYKETGQRLHISHHTVHTHIKNIYKKLNVKGRKAALQIARRKCLI